MERRNKLKLGLICLSTLTMTVGGDKILPKTTSEDIEVSQ